MQKASVRVLTDLAPVALYHSPGAADVLVTLLALAKTNVLLTCYCFDLPEGVAVLSMLMGRRVVVHMLMCQNQMNNPSCSSQYEQLLKLTEAEGAVDHLRVRQYSPKPSGSSGFSALHAKSWCIDGTVYIGGSLNFSRNAALNNEEHLMVVRDEQVVDTYQGWFDDVWFKGSVVTKDMLLVGYDKQQAAKATKRQPPSRSPSAARGTRDLAAVPEEAVAKAAIAEPVPRSPIMSPGRDGAAVVPKSSPPASPVRLAAAAPAGASSRPSSAAPSLASSASGETGG